MRSARDATYGWFLGIGIAVILSLWAPPVNAQELSKRCAAVEVNSIHVSAEIQPNHVRDAHPAIIEIASPDAARKAATLVATGPVLGSMDSNDEKTDLACTAKGVVLTATITRSANYSGAALQNVIWRPNITMAVIVLQPEVDFTVTWRMRLTNGIEVSHSQTPTYPDQEYPITVTKTVR